MLRRNKISPHIVLVNLINSLTIPLLTFAFIQIPISLLFYIFQVILLIIVSNFSIIFSIGIEIKREKINKVTNLIECFLLIQPFFLLMLIFGGKIEEYILLPISIIIISFLPGFILLRILKFNHFATWIEWPILSFTLSLTITPIIVLPVVIMDGSLLLKRLVLSIIYFLLSIIYILWLNISMKKKLKNTPIVDLVQDTIKLNLFDISILIWVLLFFLCIILSLYPSMSYVLGLDIVRHYSSSLQLAIVPKLYNSFYPGFHLFQSSIHILVNPSLELFQTSLAFLSIFSIYSFYVLAKSYLRGTNSFIPLIALIIYTISSGLGWIYFFYEKLKGEMDYMNLLRSVFEVTYWDIGYGQSSWLWFWFRPMTVGFSIFFIVLYFISRNDIPRRTYLIILISLIFALGIYHVSELTFLSLFLFISSIFFRDSDIRIKDAAFGFLVGVVFYTIFNIIFNSMFRHTELSFINLLFVNFVAFSTYIVQFFPMQFLVKRVNSFFTRKRFLLVTLLLIFCLFMGGVFEWIFSFLSRSFSSKLVSEIYYIPVMMYPVLLGIPLFFALFSIYEVFLKSKMLPEYIIVRLKIIIVLLMYTIIFGKLLSLVNVYFMDTVYYERRFLPVMWLAVSILSSISMAKLFILGKRLIKQLAMVILIISMLSTLLSVEFWLSAPLPKADAKILEGVSWISNPQNIDLSVPILTFISGSSYSDTEFAPIQYRINTYRPPIWMSVSPEIPLTLLYHNERCSAPYVFIESRDVALIKSLKNSFFLNYMIKILPIIYNNSKVSVYRIPDGVPPSTYSRIVVVKTPNKFASANMICTILSLSGYNYTTSLLDDERIINLSEIVVIPEDDPVFYAKFTSWVKNSNTKRFLIFNSNGYGPFSSLIFSEIPRDKYILTSSIESELFYYTIPSGISIKTLLLEPNNKSRVLIWYSNGTNRTPFIIEMNHTNYSIIYVNVFPLIAADSNITPLHVYSILKESFKYILKDQYLARNVCGTSQALTSVRTGNLAFFKIASIVGDILVVPDAIGMLKIPGLTNVSISIDNKMSLALTNISSINIYEYKDIKIYTTNMTMCPGIGFYACLKVRDPIIYLDGKSNIDMLFINGSNKKVDIKGERNLNISIFNEIYIYARDPYIEVNGTGVFYGMYSIFSLYPKLLCLNHNLRVIGSMKFKVLMSDVYTFITDFVWRGRTFRDPPRLLFDEYNSIKRIFFYSLIFFIILISMPYVIKLALKVSKGFRKNT